MTNCILRNFRQQTSEEGHDLRSRVQSAEALLAQKRLYQKHLRSLQQSSLARDILQGRQITNYTYKSSINVCNYKLQRPKEQDIFHSQNFLFKSEVTVRYEVIFAYGFVV